MTARLPTTAAGASTRRMSRTFVLRGEVQARLLWAFLRANWKAMADGGKPLAVTVSEYRDKRSLEQNARYWGFLLKEIAAKAWVNGKQFSDETWHEYLKGELIGKIEKPDGSLMAMSSADLSVEEFAQYMTKVEVYAIEELGVDFGL